MHAHIFTYIVTTALSFHYRKSPRDNRTLSPPCRAA